LQRPNVVVTNGVFSVVLNFGNFPAADRFLEIVVRPSGGGALTTLAPRVKLLSTPYSTHAKNAENAADAVNAVSAQNAQNATNAQNAQTAQNALQLGGTPANQFVVGNDPRLNDPRIPLPGSSFYLQNTIAPQASSNFNISGNGTAGGTLEGNIVNATTQFNIGGAAVLKSPGSFNFFAGVLAGSSNTTGTLNSFFGVNAGVFNTTGGNNAYFGFEAGRNNNAGANNAFFGKNAGRLNTTGSDNSFFGTNAGDINTTGSNNTIIGNLADLGTNNLTNANAIGARAFVESSNSLVLGSVNGKNGATADTDVGIGTTAPTANLDIDNGRLIIMKPNLRITNYNPSFTTGVVGRSANGTRSAPTASTSGDALLIIEADGYTGSGFTEGGRAGVHLVATENWTATATGAAIRFLTTLNGTNVESVSMEIENNGNVGIGTTSPAQKLDVNGIVRVGTGTTGCVQDRDGTVIAGTCSSDLRFKKNITPFSNILNGFSQLRPVNFYWRTDEFADKHFGDKQSFGLIAQEVEETFPDLVSTDEQGFKAVNYSKLPLLTIQAVKELKAENDKLKQQFQQQQTQIYEQKKKAEAQQQQLDRQSAEITELAQTLRQQISNNSPKSAIKRSKKQ